MKKENEKQFEVEFKRVNILFPYLEEGKEDISKCFLIAIIVAYILILAWVTTL